MDLSALRDLVIIFALSIGILLFSHRLRLPTIVGLLLTGVIVGPYGLRLVHDIEVVEALAEIGIILLLFTIGIEFSLHALLSLKHIVGMAGTLQVGLSIVTTYATARLLGRPGGEAVLWGFLVALSSTAIVLKLLGEGAETDSPHGRIAVGVLIFQDLSVVPMMFLLPPPGWYLGRLQSLTGMGHRQSGGDYGDRPRQRADGHSTATAPGGAHTEP